MNDPVVQSPTSEDKNLAMLAHLLGIVSGFVGALIIWLLKREQSAFIAEQAREALNFQVTMMIAYAGAWVLTFVLIGALLFPILMVVNLVLCVLAAVAVSKGEHYQYPFAIRLIS